MDGNPRRRWLTFSLRTLFVVVTVVAVYLGWAMNWIQQRRQLLAKAADYVRASETEKPESLSAPWQIRLLGEEAVVYVNFVPMISKKELARARSLFPEAVLYNEPRCTPEESEYDESDFRHSAIPVEPDPPVPTE